jgi:hypothetical protein
MYRNTLAIFDPKLEYKIKLASIRQEVNLAPLLFVRMPISASKFLWNEAPAR